MYAHFLLIVAATLCLAEPPQYRFRHGDPNFYHDTRPQSKPQDGVATTTTATSTGYPAAGFRPAPPFELPDEQPQQPLDSAKENEHDLNTLNANAAHRFKPAGSYGPPRQPQDTYGPAAPPSNSLFDDSAEAGAQVSDEAVLVAYPQTTSLEDYVAEGAHVAQLQQQSFEVPFALLQLPTQFAPAANGYF